ncbi:hypothetical protein [Pseudonocardia spinosispora]|uniref:hypothetical protein n=1 Tax=Pseudonocardia spinosispora TaxID=103441 RepID=UPI00041261DA|nr:hypothetical protein [Pseudonocardia spinosispora]
MTGTSSTEHGEPAGQDGPDQPVPGQPVKDKANAFPWQLAVSVVTWIIFGGLLVASALGVGTTTSGADQASIDTVQGALGADSVSSSGSGGQHPTAYLMIGLVMLLMALMLLIGQGWSRFVLGVLALVAVILYATGGRWEAVVAFVLMIVGLVFLLNRNTLRYLNQQR